MNANVISKMKENQESKLVMMKANLDLPSVLKEGALEEGITAEAMITEEEEEMVHLVNVVVTTAILIEITEIIVNQENLIEIIAILTETIIEESEISIIEVDTIEEVETMTEEVEIIEKKEAVLKKETSMINLIIKTDAKKKKLIMMSLTCWMITQPHYKEITLVKKIAEVEIITEVITKEEIEMIIKEEILGLEETEMKTKEEALDLEEIETTTKEEALDLEKIEMIIKEEASDQEVTEIKTVSVTRIIAIETLITKNQTC